MLSVLPGQQSDRISRLSRFFTSRVPQIFRYFRYDTKGATAAIFAISLVPTTAGLGMSIDTGRLYLARTNLQAALDSAAIAAAVEYRASSDSNTAMTVAQNTFAAAVSTTGAMLDTGSSKVDAVNQAIDLVATVSVNTPLIGLISPGNANYNIRSKSTAIIKSTGGLGKNLEVSMMLDVTISMDQSSGTSGLTKLQALKTAAKNLVTKVVQDDQSKFTSRVALAPFASGVNVGSYYNSIVGSAPQFDQVCSGRGRRRSCTNGPAWTSVVERAGAHNATDDPPSSAYFPSYYAKHGSALANNSFYSNYERNSNDNRPDSSILPLSSSKSVINTAIDGMTSDGATAGHIGIGWSWYLLSPKWTSIWSGASAPNVADQKTVKVAILMSDFDFNVYYQGGVGDMNAQAAQLCSNMKAAGIVIYTVGFQVDSNNTTAQNLFTGCATDPSKAIAASNGNELIAVYDKIAKTVVASISSPIRLSQ
jgi:Flp pilus assembly protein TadG